MLNKKIPADFQAIQDDDETILWFEKPNFIDFIMAGVTWLVLGLGWGLIDYAIFESMSENGQHMPTWFLFIHTAPVWVAILNMLRLIVVHSKTAYGYTNKRVLARTGFFGTDFHTIDYDSISDLYVNVNPLEKLMGIGTLVISVQSSCIKFIGIKKPYVIFKQLKQTALDIKTDWKYPNAKRPDHNPGYRTQYTPMKKDDK